IPVLMLTGADSTRNLVEGLDAGADDYVTKSSEIEVILARVRALLRVKAYQDRIVEQTEQLRTLYEEVTVLNERFNKDLQFARRVQESLLPLPEFSNSQVEIRSTYIPSDTLSGDFYDYFLSNERLYLFVADVSGHGLPAAILTSLLKSYLHSEAGDALSLASFMASLNDFLVSASLPSQYATALLVQLNREKTEIQFANAAHPPFLLYRPGQAKATQHEQPSHFLGAMPGMKYEQQGLSIKSGDLLFAYTDGLTDRRTAEGEFYSIDRVASIIERAGGAGIASLYDLIYEDVTSFPATDEFKDDIACVLARFR
ncbi:MAG: SpoIIE family protein phosphatase, partial [Acidobacteriota bacterium]